MSKPFAVFSRVVGDDLSVSDQPVFIDHQPVAADGTAGMGLIGADSNLGT